jgi:hypothetical protein
MKINKKPNKKKIIAGALAALIIAALVYMFVASRTGLFPFSRSSGESVEVGDQKVSLERSESEEKAIDAIAEDPTLKDQNSQNDAPTTPTQTTEDDKLKVNVLLTNVRVANGTVSASGFVTDLAESDGSCSYIFINGPNRVVKTARTLTNPTSTTCETVRFSTDELNAEGTWSVSVAYESDTASGESAKKEFTK